MNPTDLLSVDLLPIVELGLGDDRLRVAIDAQPQTLPLVPGCADVQFARVGQIGHRGRFPRSHEWEKLLSSLPPGEELLWVVRKHEGAFELFLGHKMNREVVAQSGEVVERRRSFRALLQLFSRRVFPESQLKELSTGQTSDLLRDTVEMAGKQVVVVSGMPSPKAQEESEHFVRRDDALDLWASLNDVLEPFLDEEPFTIVFSLCRARDEEVRDRLAFVLAARDFLAPHIKRQRTLSANEQTGTQATEGTTTTHGTSQQEQRGLVPRLIQMLAGSNPNMLKGTLKRQRVWERRAEPQADGNVSRYVQTLGKDMGDVLKAEGQKWLHPYRFAMDAGVGYQHSEAISLSTTTSRSEQFGESVALNELNAQFELRDKSLTLESELLRTGSGTGAFHSGAMIYASSRALARRIGQSIMATLSGAKTHVRPFQVITCLGPHVDAHLTHQGAAHEVFPGFPILSTHVAAQLLLTPEADLPGVRLRRNVFYGQPEQPRSTGQSEGASTVRLGATAFFGSFVQFGDFPPQRARAIPESEFRVPAEDLMSHLLITGTTGSGKTLRAVEILTGLNPREFQIVVIESAKQVFRNRLRREGVGTRVFTLGESREQPLRINPFFFEKGTSLKRHISVLSDALADLLPVEALIAPKLREAVQRAYTGKGWNIEAATFDGAGEPAYPSVLDLHREATRLAHTLRYSTEINANYLGALTGRTGLFLDELYQDIFAWDGDRALNDLFGDDDVIVEMDALPPSEIQMPGFILAVLLERLRARQARDGGTRRRLVLVIEEAHNLLNRKHESVRSERESGQGGHLLDQLVLLLQEGRELRLGVVVIDQSPASLADAVLKNTNTKLVHRIGDSEEAQLVGSCLGLRDEEWRDLHELDDGECIVKGKRPGKPVKLTRFPLPAEPARLMLRSGAPPNYTRATRLLDAVCRRDCEPAGLNTMADELISACCGRLDLLTYVVRKFALERALDAQRGKPEFEWSEPRLPESLGEVRGWLAEYAGESGAWSEGRARFARLVADLLSGLDVSPTDSGAGDTWWSGPLKDFERGLAADPTWSDNAARAELCGLLEQWAWLRPDCGATAGVRERLRLLARLTEPRLRAIESVLRARTDVIADAAARG